MSIVEWALLGALFGVVLVPVLNFIDVTLWQCRKFGNCPWYLKWLK